MLITDQVATAPGLTPDREHVFVELNRSGEFFWLKQSPGLPISDAIADLLLGHSQRR
jgi:predicted transcriptional regulator